MIKRTIELESPFSGKDWIGQVWNLLMIAKLDRYTAPHSEYLAGKLVFLDEYESLPQPVILRNWRSSGNYLDLFSEDPLTEWPDFSSTSREKFNFVIRTLRDGQVIGEIALQKVDWENKQANLGVALGDSKYWNKGYGTDAVRVVTRYAFQVLGLVKICLVME